MKFSILIANYNNGRYFKDCYESILAQRHQDWEVIIVDDKSTDDSIEIIKALIKDDNRFSLFENEDNKGCGFTKRKCATLVNGEIAGFLDPDDALTFDAIELMEIAHLQNPHASLVHSTFYYCDEQLNIKEEYKNAEKVGVNDRFTNLHGKVTAFSTYKMSHYLKTQGIDKNLMRAVDQDIYLKLSETGDFFFIDKPLYKYRIHSSGIASANADRALFWFLKVIANAEERRSVNLEDEVAQFLNRTDPNNLHINLANPRYLILGMIKAFKKGPGKFFKKLFLNKY